uniref:Uncharacterized protein n=1 Tax=Tanacetum cinerariifolium TaxID=118510 RepID=A0A6L2LXT4_TANCI|nr:hypothetical protein [Tanacetum cinerariifolium]GEV81831.1 hypothetical protein [Tanacetum cinerariifolium]
MFNKENYVPWTSRLLRYAKSRPNGKLIHNSIINGQYVRRMIPEPGDLNRKVPMNETFHVQIDDELTEKELKQIEADDQAIQTILLDLPKDIYAAVDSCKTAQKIWLRIQQTMKGSNIGIQEKKAKLINEWERFTSNDGESIKSYYHRFLKLMNDLKRNKHFPKNIANYTQLYDFLKYNQKEVDDLKAKRLVRTQDPLALMATSNNPCAFLALYQDQPSFNQNYMQQPMPTPEDITYPTTVMNMALALMAKAFKLNYSTPTNKNQRISSNIRNRQIAQSGMNMGQDRQMQMVGGNGGNQFRQYAGQNVGNLNGYNDVQNVRNQVIQHAVQNPRIQNVRNQNGLIGVLGNANQNSNGNGVGHFTRNCTVRPRRRDATYLQTQLLIAQKEEAGIQLQAKEFDLMVAASDLDEIEKVNANYILMANLQQASTSGTQTDKAPIYNSDGSTEQSNLGTPPKVGKTYALSKPDTSNSIPIPQGSKVMKNDKVIAPGMFRINPFKPSKEEKHMPNNVRASVRTNSITVSQPSVITKKDVNYDSNGLSSTEVDNTKTRRPQPRRNTKNDRVPSVSKSSQNKNKEVKVEEHHRKLLLSKNKKHMSSECNNVKLATQNIKSKVVCAMCKQCLNSINPDVCLLNYENGMSSSGKNQTKNVLINENQKKQKPKVKKTKKVGSIEKLASPKPNKPRSFLRWSPTGRLFDLKGKIIASSESESQSDCFKGDNACTSNPLELTVKRFPNCTSFLGRNDHVAVILGFGDLQWGNILITRVYFVEGLGHNLFSVRQFCDLNLEVAFRRNACFIRNLEGVNLLEGDRTTKPYTINLHEMASASLICVMAHASSTKSWLWHQQFKYHKEHLCPSCEQGKSKRAFDPPKPVPNSRQRLHLLHMDLCGPMRIASINGKRKPYISFLHLFGALFYPKNDREDIGKLGAKGDIGFFIGYSADSCAYRVYSRRTKKIMETMNVSFDELSAMTFEQRSSKPELQSMKYCTDTNKFILKQQIFLNTSHDVDEINSQQQHAQKQGNQDSIQPKTIADNVPNAMFNANTFVNPFATSSTSASESSSLQNVDPSNMHTFYQPYPHEFQWTNDHPIEQVLVPTPDNITPLTLKWLFKNKHDEEQTVIRNKTRLVMRGYRQEEGIDFKASFASSNYVLEILKKYGMESCDPVGTPMEIKYKFDLDQNGTPVDATKYRSMIGALMYLKSSRPDIVHATCLCARYQAKPTEKHLKEDFGFELTEFSDADYSGCKDTFRSTSGGAQFLGEKLLTDYGFYFNMIPIYCDSKSAIAISCNLVQHSRTKHIVVRYHFIKEHMEKGTIELYFVKTDYQLADLFTKALPVDQFNYLVCRLGMRSVSPQELDRLAKS